MKQVLLIDESSIFKEFIRNKLTDRGIDVEIGVGLPDSLSKMRSLVPDLILLDYNLNKGFVFDLLDAKKDDPNGQSIPLVLTVQKLEKDAAKRLADYNIRHIIQKPLKIDQFFETVSGILGIDFDIDKTPCILDARVNDNILFIEIAQGLNREKLDLLRYKITELIELYGIAQPRILVMMSDLSLSFIDGPNLELLLTSLTADQRVRLKNIKVLTLDTFAKEYISGDRRFSEIQVVSDLGKALDGLIKDTADQRTNSAALTEKILTTPGASAKDATLEMRFRSEIDKEIKKSTDALNAVATNMHIAVIDDDVVIRNVLGKTFSAINAKVDLFENGNAFLASTKLSHYELIFLDLMMPGLNGYEVLLKLRERDISTPVIVLSAISKREAVLKVLAAGVKSYMIKPLKPETILKKAIEVLNSRI